MKSAYRIAAVVVVVLGGLAFLHYRFNRPPAERSADLANLSDPQATPRKTLRVGHLPVT